MGFGWMRLGVAGRGLDLKVGLGRVGLGVAGMGFDFKVGFGWMGLGGAGWIRNVGKVLDSGWTKRGSRLDFKMGFGVESAILHRIRRY